MWLIKLNALTNFLAFFIGIIFYKRFPKEIKTIFYFVAFGVLTETYYRIHFYLIMKNGMPIGHFYFPVAIFIAVMFYKQILTGFIKPVWIIAIVVLYEIYCIINPIFVQGLFQYPSITGSIGSLIVFLLSVAYFVKVMVEAKIKKLSVEPVIWINSAFLIYYTVGFFYHSLYNLRTTASMEVALFAIKFFSSLNLLFYLIISIAFILTVNSTSIRLKKDRNH
jgi:hypothetical protein